MWIARELEQTLKTIARSRPALILTGSRQTGKTSLLARCFPKHNYVSLDLPINAEEAEVSGETFLQKHPPPLVVDEVQYAPKLLHWVKSDIDQHRNKYGRYCFTGSQKFALMDGISESLAGRVSILECHSLSSREFEKFSGKKMEKKQLLEWMWQGGYPELHVASLSPERFFSDYISTYLERDVRSVLQVKSLRDFDRFLRLLATRTGQLLDYSDLATNIGISPNTIKSWVSVLEASNIIALLEPYFANLGKRIVKTPKLYFLDTGLTCFLNNIRSPKELEQSPLLGSLFETHTFGQIIRNFANQGKTHPIYFYRDHLGHEVDFVIPVGGKFYLMECKWTELPPQTTKGFVDFENWIGEEKVVKKVFFSPIHGSRKLKNNTSVEDTIGLQFLD